MTGSIWAIVPAAGRGTRFGGPLPKQYLQAGGQPLMAYTLAALAAHPALDENSKKGKEKRGK